MGFYTTKTQLGRKMAAVKIKMFLLGVCHDYLLSVSIKFNLISVNYCICGILGPVPPTFGVSEPNLLE